MFNCYRFYSIEVEIHVCDEVKNMKKDFRCSQKLLVSKMGYFAEVTTGKFILLNVEVNNNLKIFASLPISSSFVTKFNSIMSLVHYEW